MKIEIITPQFERTDGITPALPDDFKSLHLLSKETLKQIGCQKWDEPDKDGFVLWLFPADWYDYIPNGLEVIDINNNKETFKHGQTDNDRRFGALSFGFLRKE